MVKGAVVDALLRGKAWTLTLNDLLTGMSRDEEQNAAKEALATTLMGYARANPHTDPRPADAGHRVRSGGGPPRLFDHDAEAEGVGVR